MRAGSHRARAHTYGYTFVAVLVLLALCSLGLAVAGPVWSDQVKREREQELLRVGNLFAQAISNYREAFPGSLKQYPPSLEALLLDSRYVGTVRHLRAVYDDPVNPGQPWGLLLDGDNRVKGVFSQSTASPVAQGQLKLPGLVLAPAAHYADWKFTVTPKP